MMEKIKVGIVGAAGYTAGELIRILINHPKAELISLQSESQSGLRIDEVHTDLVGETDLLFSSEIRTSGVDVLFLCKGHGQSLELIKSFPELLETKLIDLSQDFRLPGDHYFIYGLPEINREEISSATHVANPGCFATCIQLGILPAIKEGIVDGDIQISGITGSTGAGQSFSQTSHFSWRSNNASVYKPLTHQHLKEIGAAVAEENNQWNGSINFIPYRGAFTRGIITTSYFSTNASEEELQTVYRDAYADASFTHVSRKNPDLKMVVNTNKAIVHATVIDGQGVVISVIDNLLKGASGQAVQNMNLLFGLDEKVGLNLKTSTF
ncbi:MAG: N-acetyl-gamma-glutamyl-phosphate reductase [Cyclobacteriaceae bacterium]